MGLLSNRIDRESLKPGDHIYSWRAFYIYAHHELSNAEVRTHWRIQERMDGSATVRTSAETSIYEGDNTVIHFTRQGEEVGTGTFIDTLLVSSGPSQTQVPCTTCTAPLQEGHGVVSSCLDCFLSGGILYRFEYSVNPALFLGKARGGTCTLAETDPGEVVVSRAKHLLEKNGFGCYNVFKNNCEDFAMYCKTGLLVLEQGAIGQGGQVVSIIGGPLAAILATPLRLLTTNVYGMAASAVVMYCANRYAADIGSGLRRDVVKVSAEDLTQRLAVGLFQVIVPTTPVPCPSSISDLVSSSSRV